MSQKIHTCEVVKKTIETRDAFSLYLKLPDNMPYHPGQFITLLLETPEEKIQRSYSLSSLAKDDLARITIKRIKNGIGSQFLYDHVHEGDLLLFKGPDGLFTLGNANDAPRIFIGAGSGITPLMGMLKQSLEQNPNVHLLFYGNRQEEDVIFFSELRALKKKYPQLHVFHFYSKKSFLSQLFSKKKDILAGRIYPEIIWDKIVRMELDFEKAEFYICGPENLNIEMKQAMMTYGIEEDSIKVEFYTPPVQEGENAGIDANLTFHMSGTTGQINVKKGKSILAAMMEEGMDPPHSCRSGSCCTCMARLKEGRVKMIRADALSKNDINNGFILTCQAHPISEEVTIDFNIYD